MNNDIRHFALGDDASIIDRATLRVWKTWLIWLRPILFASVLMMIVSAAIGTTIAKSGGIDNGFVGMWSPANYASSAIPSTGTEGGYLVASESVAWTRGILAQFISVLGATVAAWFVLRRSVRPTAVGLISGLVVVVVHLSLSRQWSFQPVGGAPNSYQATAVVALWLLPVMASALGVAIHRWRPAHSARGFLRAVF
jgi:hypothetical protein